MSDSLNLCVYNPKGDSISTLYALAEESSTPYEIIPWETQFDDSKSLLYVIAQSIKDG